MTSPFAFLADVDWSSDLAAYLTPFAQFGHLHLMSFAVWITIHFGSGYIYRNHTNMVANGIKTAKANDKLKGKERSDSYYDHRVSLDLMIKTVALIHAIVSSTGALTAFFDGRGAEITYEQAYTYEPFYYAVNAISGGYFLYDFVMAIYERDPAFLIHGSLSYAIFGHSVAPFLNHVGSLFLMYEVSTIFLNIRSIMLTVGATKHPLFNPIQYTFFAVFMLVRMVWGTWFSVFHMQPFLFRLFFNYYNPPHSYIATAIFSFSNFALQCLNIMWSVMMIKTIRRQLKGERKTKTA